MADSNTTVDAAAAGRIAGQRGTVVVVVLAGRCSGRSRTAGMRSDAATTVQKTSLVWPLTSW